MKILDLRSDTLSLPSQEMREAMLKAEVGDSFYDEDPTVVQLEQKVAGLFGKPAALFVPSGTMSNQLAMGVWASRGEAVIVPQANHIVQYETGALGRLFGMQSLSPMLLEDGLSYDADWLQENIVPEGTLHAPAWACVSFENTQMKLGGRIHPFENFAKVRSLCGKLGLGMHLDGARIWNASAAESRDLVEYGKNFDSLSVCFSKGLGAPVGSCLLGDKAFVQRAKKLRKMMGGTMRQAGILAAGALYALENHRKDLHTDHLAAKGFAERAKSDFPFLDVNSSETNISVLQAPSEEEANRVAKDFELRLGVRLGKLGPRTLRAVTYRDVSTELIARM